MTARHPRRSRGGREAPDADRAFEIAVAYLGPRPRSRWEVQRRLQRAGAEDQVIGATLDHLTRLGYLDDTAFARWWAEQRDRHAPRGRRMLEAELRQHGVPREVVEAFRESYADPERALEDAHLPANEDERARVALKQHLRGRPLPEDPKALQRIGMYLVRRGFDAERVRSALRDAGAEASDG